MKIISNTFSRGTKILLKSIFGDINMTLVELPEELVRNLFKIAPIEDVFKLSYSIKALNFILDDEAFWKEKVNQNYPDYFGIPYENSWIATAKLLVHGKNIFAVHHSPTYLKENLKVKGTTTLRDLTVQLMKGAIVNNRQYYIMNVNGNRVHTLIQYIGRPDTIEIRKGIGAIHINLNSPLYTIESYDGINMLIDIRGLEAI